MEAKTCLSYSRVYNYIRYSWSKQFYFDISEFVDNISLTSEQLSIQYLNEGEPLKSLKQRVWDKVQSLYTDYYFHPETFYNTVVYRVNKVLKEFEKKQKQQVVELIALRDLD